MRTLTHVVLLAGLALWAWPLTAQQQQSCSRYSIIIGSPEDKLTLAVNGAQDPSAKIAALEAFAQEHPDSSYLPCVEQLLTKNYFQLQQYDKAIAAGQKAVAANHLDVSFLENLLQAYIASGNASDGAFDVIMKAAQQIKQETIVPQNQGETAEQFEQAKKAAAQQAKEDRSYMLYAMLNLVPRVADAAKQIKFLDQFCQAYPEIAQEQAGSLDYRYAAAYAQANQPAKADEYAEKAIAADPHNLEALNFAAYEYAFRVPAKRPRASEYAKKVIELVSTMKKPEGVSEGQFTTQKNSQEGMARLTLGYLNLVTYADSHRVAGAVQEFSKAADLLAGNAEMQGEAYYFLGFSYETLLPPDHRRALAALEKSVRLSSSMQGRARDLLAKVRRVAR